MDVLRVATMLAAVAVAFSACAEAQRPAPVDAHATAGSMNMPAWAGGHPAEAAVPAQPYLEGVAVAAPVGRPAPDARWRTRRIGDVTESDPVDELLRVHRGDRRVGAMSLRDAPVTDTLRMFAEMGALDLVFADGTADRRVTLDLRDVTLAEAFRAVLAAAHLGAVVDNGVMQVGPEGAVVPPRGPGDRGP